MCRSDSSRIVRDVACASLACSALKARMAILRHVLPAADRDQSSSSAAEEMPPSPTPSPIPLYTHSCTARHAGSGGGAG
jgi:hypothetical protein